MRVNGEPLRVAFQGEPGAFSEEAAVRLLGDTTVTLPRPTFAAGFRAVAGGEADALLVPIENSLAGSVLRVYDLLLESELTIAAETILPVELHLIGCPGATLAGIRSVESHPMALAQCERMFAEHPGWARVAAEDTAGSVRNVVESADLSRAAIAGPRAALCHGGAILARDVQDNSENFTRFLLLAEPGDAMPRGDKLTLALRLSHLPGALLAVLEPFARRGLNLLKIESRPIHGCPWEYQFFLDVEVGSGEPVVEALQELRRKAQSVRVLGRYTAARPAGKSLQTASGRNP
ncbi:MAG TPA: prephenate dehydratase [Candidatus Acidoferrales bacterium]|nr:prephenate dehydratase [Candidatus Acidoferrales bacterium]